MTAYEVCASSRAILHATTKSARSNTTGSPLGFEANLWLSANKLRNNMDAAEYKHVVLGLIFRTNISDGFLLLD